MTIRKGAGLWRLALVAGAGALWLAGAQAQDSDRAVDPSDPAYDGEYVGEDQDSGNVTQDDVFSDDDPSDALDPDADVYTPPPQAETPGDPALDMLAPSTDLSQPDSGAPASTDSGGQRIAVLRGLEKVTARVREIDVPVGTPVRFGRLEITVRQCHSRPPEETPETTAYLDIDDYKLDGSVERIFSGWMFASSPALNPLQHPVYDVWVINCKTRAPGTSASSR